MALTDKGKNALNYIKEFYPVKPFSAKDLSNACGEKVAAATLNAVANNGFLIKLGGSPVQFQTVNDLDELLAAALEEQNKGCDNSNLKAAKDEQNDEFYTLYEDIEKEVAKYRRYFKDKIIYLPCDDPAEKKSEFWSYFVNHFDSFGLKKLIATHFDENGKAYKIWIEKDLNGDGYISDDDAQQEDLQGNGDFLSQECTDILNESDIVITNPPFSKFRFFINWIIEANKQFLIVRPMNALKYKEVFPFIQNGSIKNGYNSITKFKTPNNTIEKFGNVGWITNFPISKENEELLLIKSYNAIDYPKYDNYDAIEVGHLADIPKDYNGIMGVPITILEKYNPTQFKILKKVGNAKVNNKTKYERIFIQRVK